MASIHKKTDSPNWYGAFYLPDGRRALRSTGATDRRKAKAIVAEWDRLSRIGREQRNIEHQARDTIARIYEIASGDTLPAATLGEYLDRWLKRRDGEIAESSLAEYGNITRRLKEHFESRLNRPMDGITRRDAVTWRDALAERVAASTVNKALKISGVIWGDAVRDGVCRENIFSAKLTKPVKAIATKRRPFSPDEIKRILAACSGDWRGMVFFGLYTGQRLRDLAALTWRQIDFENRTIVNFITRKTGREMDIPIAGPLLRELLSMPSADNPDDPLFPTLFNSVNLSNQFYDILHAAGLVAQRNHQTRGKGRDTKRATGNLSFHCLRHSCTSWLKNAGASEAVTMDIVGHDSTAISRSYTKIETETKRNALDKLPDIG